MFVTVEIIEIKGEIAEISIFSFHHNASYPIKSVSSYSIII